jgi:hypothetical protein
MNRTETNRGKNVEEDRPNEFRIFNFFFQIFMIRFGRTELELRASFALKSIKSNGLFGKVVSSIRPNRIIKI